MGIGNKQIGWTNEANLLWEIAKKLERLIQVAGPAPAPPILPALILTFESSFPGGVPDPNNVSDWNAKLGSTFTSVSISGLEARLSGGSPFNMIENALNFTTLVSIDDQANSVLSIAGYSLAANQGLNTIKLPALTAINGDQNFLGSGQTGGDVILYIPLCTSVGATVGLNYVFSSAFQVSGQTITLTVPASRMTCNGGLPDGDIQYLQANNTVTIVTV